jgi:ADP-ribose pyrophosphatase YjhB (NUDIX family)
MPARDAFCSSCGAAYADTTTYPRTCGACGLQTWANPVPVSVVLCSVLHPLRPGRVGLLCVRRAIEPQKGKLALVGGFLEEHETVAQGGVREVREEAGVVVDPATVAPFWFTSTEPRPNRVLLFSLAATLPASALVPFVPSSETTERGLVFGSRGLDALFAFPLHVAAVRRFYAALGAAHGGGDGDADWLSC